MSNETRLRVEIGTADSALPLAAGDYPGAVAQPSPGAPLLDIFYNNDACHAANRGYSIDTVLFQDQTLVALDLRFHCGAHFTGEVHYRDIGRLDTDAVSIEGLVWEDQGLDGVRDGSGDDPDRPLSGVTVELLKAGRAVARTTSSPEFRFYVPYDTYQLRVMTPRGMLATPHDLGAEDRDSDVDPTTLLSDPIVPPPPEEQTTLLDGGRITQAAPLTVGLGYPNGQAQLPIASTRLAPLQAGDRSTYSESENDTSRYATDTVLPGGVRLDGSAVRTVRDSSGNELGLSNDDRGLRLHRARARLANGRSYDYRFTPALVLLPPQVELAPHQSGGRVAVRTDRGDTVTVNYEYAADFKAGHGGVAGSLVRFGAAWSAPLGLESDFTLEFTGSVRGTPVARRIRAVEYWTVDGGLHSSIVITPAVVGAPASHRCLATAFRRGAQHSLDGDRRSDVLGLRADGEFGLWQMRGLAPPVWQEGISRGGAGLRLLRGDVDGDGRPELVSLDIESGLVSVERNDGVILPMAFAASDARLLGLASSNRDGRARLLWRGSTSNALTRWALDPTALQVTTDTINAGLSNSAAGSPAAWRLFATGDVDANGSDDLLWHDPTGARYVLWLMDGAMRSATAVKRLPAPWRVAALDDFDGDGRADLLWHNPGSREVRLWSMDGATVRDDTVIGLADRSTTVVDSGDYDGDGAADLLWQRGSNGPLSGWLMRGATVRSRAALGRLPAGYVPTR